MKKKHLFSDIHKVRFFPFILVFYETIVYLSNDMYLPALPAITKEFRISQDLTQYSLIAWFLGASTLQLFIGPLSDKYGRKKTLLWGTVLFIISSFLCTYAPTIGILISARFFQGSACCFIFVAGYASIHTFYDRYKAIATIALMGSISVLAPALGPLFGAVLLEFSSWRFIFILLTYLGLFSFIGLSLLMPESKSAPSSYKYVLNQYKSIFLNSRFLKFATATALSAMSLFIWVIESPFIIIDTYNKSPLYFGVCQLLIFGSNILGAYYVMYYSAKINLHRLIIMALLLLSIVSSLLTFLAWHNYSLEILITLVMILAFCSSLCFSPLNRLTIESTQAPMGQRAAIFSTIISASAALSGLIVTLFNCKTVLSIAWLILGCSLLAILTYLSIGKDPFEKSFKEESLS